MFKLKHMDYFCELGHGINQLNNCINVIEEKKNEARAVKEQKKKMMTEN